MSTWAVVSVKQEDGTYKSISVANDGYAENSGVGYMLSFYYYNKTSIDKLIDRGNIDSLKRGMLLDEEYESGIQLKVMSTVVELLDYCMDKSIDYLYVYEDGVWQWTYVMEGNYSLIELTTSDVTDYVDRELIDEPTFCSYSTAVRWGGTNIVLLNNISDIDENFDPYENYVRDDENGEDDEDEDEYYYPEFFQFYITNMSNDDIEWYRKVFPDLIYSFSEVLDAWILCVPHYGTSWDYVGTQYIGNLTIPNEEFERFNSN